MDFRKTKNLHEKLGEQVSGLWGGGKEVVVVVVEVVIEGEGSRERWYGCDKWVYMKCMFDEQLVIAEKDLS